MLFLLWVSSFLAAFFFSSCTNGKRNVSKKSLQDTFPKDEVSQSDQESIQLKLSYGVTVDRKAIITCDVEVTSNKESTSWSTLYLLCPQVPTSVCYMDCTPSCVLDQQGCTVPKELSSLIQSCSYNQTRPNQLTVNYVINMDALSQTGEWNCAYRGKKAPRPLELRAVEDRTFLNNIRTPQSSPITTILPNVTPLKEVVSREHFGGNNTATTGMMKAVVTEQFTITRPELFILLSVVLVISLLLNTILSIRCTLTKSYLDNMARGKKNRRCLESLLCFDHQSKRMICPDVHQNGHPSFNMRATPLLSTSYPPSFSQTSTSLHNGGFENGFYQTPPTQWHISPDGTPVPSIYGHLATSRHTPSMVHPVPRQYGPIDSRVNYFIQQQQQQETPHHMDDMQTSPNRSRVCVSQLGNNLHFGANDGSATGSIVLTNDSMSFTEGLSGNHPITTTNQQTQLNQTDMLENYRSDLNEMEQPAHMNENSTTQTNPGLENHTEPLSVEQMFTTKFESSMTPLVVRLPSGESGLLICPTPHSMENTNDLTKIRRSCSTTKYPSSSTNRPALNGRTFSSQFNDNIDPYMQMSYGEFGYGHSSLQRRRRCVPKSRTPPLVMGHRNGPVCRRTLSGQAHAPHVTPDGDDSPFGGGTIIHHSVVSDDVYTKPNSPNSMAQ